MYQSLNICCNVSVETTDHCNQRCHYCNQTNKIHSMHGAGRKNEFMDPALFRLILERMSAGRPTFESFTPYWGGEPLLHPQTAEFLRSLFDTNRRTPFFKRFHMNTNAFYLTEEVSNILLDYAQYIEEQDAEEGQMYLTFSLDSVNPQTYARIRGVPESQCVTALENVNRFLRLRAQRGLRRHFLIYQFVVCEENINELQDFLRYWKTRLTDLGVPHMVMTKQDRFFNDRDVIFIRQQDTGVFDTSMRFKLLHEQVVASLEPSDRPVIDASVITANTSAVGTDTPATNVITTAVSQTDWLKAKKPCAQLFNMLILSKDGTVVPCCKDLFFELKLGNIKDNSFEEMWLGEQLKHLRLEQVEGHFARHTICANCVNPPGGELSLTEVAEYLQDVGRLDLLGDYVSRHYGSPATSRNAQTQPSVAPISTQGS